MTRLIRIETRLGHTETTSRFTTLSAARRYFELIYGVPTEARWATCRTF